MAKRSSKEELRYAFWGHIADRLANLAEVGIRWGSMVAITFLIYRSVESLSGKYTFADIGVGLVGQLEISEAFAYIFGGGGALYGWRQRKLRADHTERLSARNAKLEARMDPKRSSSRLTPRGKTRPEDKS